MIRKLFMAAVSAFLIAGIVVVVMIYTRDVRGPAWDAIGVALMAFAAVGAVVLVVAHAHDLESKEARPHDHSTSA